MRKHDEALIWAMKQPESLALPVIRMAQGYRAGQAASAARIKALEEAIREALRRLNEYADMAVDQWNETVADGGITAWMVIRQELQTVVAGDLARALLKEPDQ